MGAETKDKDKSNKVKSFGSLNTTSMKRIEDIRENKGAPPTRIYYGLLKENCGEPSNVAECSRGWSW